MSYESDECKLLIDESIHDYLHDDTENEMAVKDWFYDLRKQAAKADEYEAKAKAYDEIVDCLEKQVAYGLKDSEVLSEIDYLIRETFHNSKNNIYRRTEERSE